jgi:multisubunit Na+/H+ antiporter MnhB subunit
MLRGRRYRGVPGIGLTELVIIAIVFFVAAFGRPRFSRRFRLRDLLVAVTVIAIAVGAIGLIIR